MADARTRFFADSLAAAIRADPELPAVASAVASVFAGELSRPEAELFLARLANAAEPLRASASWVRPDARASQRASAADIKNAVLSGDLSGWVHKTDEELAPWITSMSAPLPPAATALIVSRRQCHACLAWEIEVIKQGEGIRGDEGHSTKYRCAKCGRTFY